MSNMSQNEFVDSFMSFEHRYLSGSQKLLIIVWLVEIQSQQISSFFHFIPFIRKTFKTKISASLSRKIKTLKSRKGVELCNSFWPFR